MNRKVIALIPAAGLANRIAPLPLSKEIFPVRYYAEPRPGSPRTQTTMYCLIDKMAAAGIKQAYVILRDGKWDIPAYMTKIRLTDFHIAYLLAGSPLGAPFSLIEAYPFVKDYFVALGFPDILLPGTQVYENILDYLYSGDTDVVLGLFPARHVQTVDMVELDDDQKVRNIQIKPPESTLQFTWGIAAWRPRFNHFMHDYLLGIMPQCEADYRTGTRREYYMSEVINAALGEGFDIRGIPVADEPFVDIGTPEGLAHAIGNFDTLRGT